MGRVGTWTYWFKAPDFDITFTTNKKNLPKNQPYVQQFNEYTSKGINAILIYNGKDVFVRKNMDKLSDCGRMQLGYEIQRKLHDLLDTPFPDKEYKKRFEKRVKGCKLK